MKLLFVRIIYMEYQFCKGRTDNLIVWISPDGEESIQAYLPRTSFYYPAPIQDYINKLANDIKYKKHL